jgi:hypothetical protein
MTRKAIGEGTIERSDREGTIERSDKEGPMRKRKER